MKPIVIVESPYAGDVETNLRYARAAVRDCILRGEAPYASHLLYPGALNDEDAIERRLGIETGFEFRRVADRVVFYVDLGISRGMQLALGACRHENKAHEMRMLGEGSW